MTLAINGVDWPGMPEEDIWSYAYALEHLGRTVPLEAWMKAYDETAPGEGMTDSEYLALFF